jgi:two-component system LytT family sensor kinase
MHPALKTLLVSLLIGLSFGTYLYFTYDHRPARIVISIISSISIGSLMMLAIYFRHYFTTLTSYQSLKVMIMIILLLVAALLGSEITFVSQTFVFDNDYKLFAGGNIYVLNILVVLVTGIPIYVSEEWKTVLNTKMLQQQYQLLKLEQQKTSFELELLRAKINPHFLYNVHNTIAGLISKDPIKAEEMVILLSRFFRFTLNKNSATFHLVKDEVAIITTYLEMQKIRYEQRLIYTITADSTVLNLSMPSFILQPLVENAIKHGIETTVSEGFINVSIQNERDTICITISDTGPQFSDKPDSGMGLQMVMNKLKLLYGSNFKFELNNTPHKNVSLIIPKQYENDFS